MELGSREQDHPSEIVVVLDTTQSLKIHWQMPELQPTETEVLTVPPSVRGASNNSRRRAREWTRGKDGN